MKRLVDLRLELAKMRTDLEFIEGQLNNDALLGGDTGLGELSDGERDKLYAKNEELMSRVIVLETLLEVQ